MLLLLRKISTSQQMVIPPSVELFLQVHFTVYENRKYKLHLQCKYTDKLVIYNFYMRKLARKVSIVKIG